MPKTKALVFQVRGEKFFFETPVIMGILNVTPDSFSEKSEPSYAKASEGRQKLAEVSRGEQSAYKISNKAWQMVKDGAGIIDVGGESTAPGSKDVSVEEELRRVVPIVKKLKIQNSKLKTTAKNLKLETRHPSSLKLRRTGWGVSTNYELRTPNFLLSVDTYKLAVAREIIKLGADIINDVTALRQGGRELGELIAKSGVGVVLMYAKDDSPRTTLNIVQYGDVVSEIGDFLQKRMEFALSCGIKKEQIIIDPGMGAFVSIDPKPSLEILRRLREFKKLGCPILVGASRKGFIGIVGGGRPTLPSGLGGVGDRHLPVNQRLEGGLACAAVAAENGADIVRTHDVKETVRFFKVWQRLKERN